MSLAFFKDRSVFLTGHTGFKGSWLSVMLQLAGARITGFALEPSRRPNLFELCGLADGMQSVIGDVRDRDALHAAFAAARPEIVIHMAAQPLVGESYRNPAATYETNVMGTVNLLDCVRTVGGVRSVLNVTTDKVYDNREWWWGYRETDPLDGFDPYSNSKSCSELVTHSYYRSFFAGNGTAVSTARAGNVIGGGDFAVDRLIPDCLQAVQAGRPVPVRSPDSVRPWQHVLEPLFAYLLLVQRQYEDPGVAGSYNIGPGEGCCITTRALVELFCRIWGDGCSWVAQEKAGFHEAGLLRLDCSKIRSVLGWAPVWPVETAVRAVVEWERAYLSGADVRGVILAQIRRYMEDQGTGSGNVPAAAGDSGRAPKPDV